MAAVLDFLNSKRRVFLLLGDTGSGKSTFCKQFLLNLWRDYKQGGRIPIFVDLRDIERPQDDLIVTRLQEYGFSDANCRELLQQRQVVLICDGYDESRLTTSLYTKKLCQLDVKMIITCRNTYLGRDYQGRFYPLGNDKYDNKCYELFEEATIVPFSESNIQDYIKQHILDLSDQALSDNSVVPSYDDIWEKLSAVPNLMKLASNPFLLSLALGALPLLSVDTLDPTKNKATRLLLFDRFVEGWIGINKCRLQESNLDPEARSTFYILLDKGFSKCVKNFSKKLAEAMHEHQRGRLVVKFSQRQNKAWKVEFFGSKIDSTLLREASLLLRDGILHWFIHDSLFHYFRSLEVFDPDESDDDDDFDGGGDDSHGSGGGSFSNGGQGVSDNNDSNDHAPGANSVSASNSGGSTGSSSGSFGGRSGSSGGSAGSFDGNAGSDGSNSGSVDSNGGPTGGNSYLVDRGIDSGSSHDVSGNGECPRQDKDGYRSRRRLNTNKSRISTASDPLSKENFLEDPDVLEFLVERARSDSRFKKRLLSTIEQSKLSLVPRLAAANAITILVKSGESIDSLDLDGVFVPSETQLAMVYTAEASGKSLIDTINNIIDLANLDPDNKTDAATIHGNRSATPSPESDDPVMEDIDIRELCEKVAESMAKACTEKNLVVVPSWTTPSLSSLTASAPNFAPNSASGITLMRNNSMPSGGRSNPKSDDATHGSTSPAEAHGGFSSRKLRSDRKPVLELMVAMDEPER
ncbi:hypothetical protein BGZ96_002953, partial [Linnemannia gamsii]